MLSTIYGLLVGLSGPGVPGCCIVTAREGLHWLPVLLFAALSLLVQHLEYLKDGAEPLRAQNAIAGAPVRRKGG